MLKFIKLFLIFPLFFAVERLCHRATDGFALVNIYSPKREENHFADIQEIPPINVQKALNQPFYYFNAGSQSYVFLSEDGKTVLKFFKFQHMRIPYWIDLLPLPKNLAKKKALKKKLKHQTLTKTLNSYKIAYEKMREETGLLFVHLAPSTHLNQSVTIYDKIGKKHLIDLDRVEFVLQQKGNLVYETIDRWIAANEIKKAKDGLEKLLQLALIRCQKGILDRDPDFSTNFGFIGDKPIQLDAGRFSLDQKEKNHSVYSEEMFRITRELQKWIEKNHPDLLEFFNCQMKRIDAQG